jgi:integrative and conjugative element protein (TIGR02256 family)
MIAEQRWETSSGEYAFLIETDAWLRIESECRKAHGRETGGVLIGFYAEDESTAVVTEASGAPSDSGRGRSWFWRGVVGLKDLMARRWTQKRRTYYLGEWHYHPVLYVEPSGSDLTQMRDISQDSNYHCRKPIMLIVGKESNEGRPMRAFVFPQGKAHIEFHIISQEAPADDESSPLRQ